MPIIRIDTKLIFFAHVPKCGGSAVEKYLTERFGPLAFIDRFHLQVDEHERWSRTSPQHVTAAAVQRFFPNQFFDAQFALVRHPVRRLVSVFLYQRDMEKLVEETRPFGDWLDELPEIRKRQPHAFDNHIRPMAEMVPQSAHVFQLESGMDPVIEWLDEIAGESDGPRCIERVHSHAQWSAGKSARRGAWPDVTEADREKIAAQYDADFERFGYDFGADS